jgi:hypothetical protein
MPAWNDLLTELESQPTEAEKAAWVTAQLSASLGGIRARRGNRNVIFYASAFLQKPAAPAQLLQLTHEEINGFMSVVYGMNWSENLTLVLHTPGGITNAAETVVEYLCSKFADIEVIVPTYSMSAGTMISLAANRIVMGRQSQLGPIDPQLQMASGRFTSARAIVEQFERAKSDILGNVQAAHVWAPALHAIGPALLQEAQNALDYGELMVAKWLKRRMLAHLQNGVALSDAAAKHFNDATTHKSHGRRIDRNEARSVQLIVEDLESDQQLQEFVLSAYHIVTILFEKGPAAKVLISHAGRQWVKNVGTPPVVQQP